MDQTEAFFTHTIVGAPLTVLLGRRQAKPQASSEGLKVGLGSGQQQLSDSWAKWAVLSHACDPVGQPRMRPGPVRRWLERRALLIALAGLFCLGASALYWGVHAWI